MRSSYPSPFWVVAGTVVLATTVSVVVALHVTSQTYFVRKRRRGSLTTAVADASSPLASEQQQQQDPSFGTSSATSSSSSSSSSSSTSDWSDKEDHESSSLSAGSIDNEPPARGDPLNSSSIMQLIVEIENDYSGNSPQKQSSSPTKTVESFDSDTPLNGDSEDAAGVISELANIRPTKLFSTDSILDSSGGASPEEIKVAFCGNSMFYFNDCPRLLQRMLEGRYDKVTQDSCLRGGASLPSLWEKGNGMQEKFAVDAARLDDGSYDIGSPTVKDLLTRDKWDFVILNDHTQAPARLKSRQACKDILQEQYAELLVNSGATPIVLQTPAYRLPNIRNTEDLGDFEAFSEKLEEGCNEYAEHLKAVSKDLDSCCVAPLGEAFRWFYRYNKEVWKKLYSWDNFHFSPSGTWLEACILYCTIVGEEPPPYNVQWWRRCRRMQPPDQDPLPLPTLTEAAELRRVACLICGLLEDKPLEVSKRKQDENRRSKRVDM